MRRHVRIDIGDQLGDTAVNGVVEQRGAHEVERRFSLSLVDVDALAGAVAMIEGGEDGRQREAW